ncbi:MAG: metal-dependent transcriptional regulator [Pseudonocardia sp.]|nr:metal-dependent transcriptional regulator [Pseudonocardia sp.]
MTAAVEDYLKTIFLLSTRGEPVTTGALARELHVSSPSVSAMMKRLSDGHLVDRGTGVHLTEQGVREALRVVRRHRLLETFLAQSLGMSWDEVHVEAELLEHALSERLEARIDAALGHPTRDPHGDPIPPAAGAHDESWGRPLAGTPSGSRFRVERVSDRDSAALRYLGEKGIRPGFVLEVGDQEPYGGSFMVRLGGEQIALGQVLTHLVFGTIIEEES